MTRVAANINVTNAVVDSQQAVDAPAIDRGIERQRQRHPSQLAAMPRSRATLQPSHDPDGHHGNHIGGRDHQRRSTGRPPCPGLRGWRTGAGEGLRQVGHASSQQRRSSTASSDPRPHRSRPRPPHRFGDQGRGVDRRQQERQQHAQLAGRGVSPPRCMNTSSTRPALASASRVNAAINSARRDPGHVDHADLGHGQHASTANPMK